MLKKKWLGWLAIGVSVLAGAYFYFDYTQKPTAPAVDGKSLVDSLFKQLDSLELKTAPAKPVENAQSSMVVNSATSSQVEPGSSSSSTPKPEKVPTSKSGVVPTSNSGAVPTSKSLITTYIEPQPRAVDSLTVRDIRCAMQAEGVEVMVDLVLVSSEKGLEKRLPAFDEAIRAVVANIFYFTSPENLKIPKLEAEALQKIGFIFPQGKVIRTRLGNFRTQLVNP